VAKLFANSSELGLVRSETLDVDQEKGETLIL
jgi:hypothetical protein